MHRRRWGVVAVAVLVGVASTMATAGAAPPVKVSSSTALTVDVPASVAGQAVSLRATVSAPAATAGKVAFRTGARSLGTAAVAGGVATLVTRKLPVGSLALTAQFLGSATVATSTSAVVPGTVVKAPTSTALVVDDLAPAGGVVHVTARVTVDPRSNLALKGKVKLMRGTKLVKAVKLVGGVAAVALPVSARTPTPGGSVPPGTLDLRATYQGSKLLGASAANGPTQATATSIAPPSPARVGEPLTLAATVHRVGASSGPPISGTVTFRVDATVLGTASVTSGVASIVTTALGAGNHVVRADYSGDARYGSSTSSGAAVVIDPAPVATTTDLSADANVVVSGSPVTFTASVAAGGTGTPTGTVELRDGDAVLGVVALTGGSAELSPVLAEGEHTVVATYSGDGTFAGSVSNAAVVVVIPAEVPSTTTRLESSANPATVGDAVTFTATVSPSGADGPTGTVELREGTTVLASSPLTDGTAAIVLTSLPIGTHSLVAVYGGDDVYTGSASDPLAQEVAGHLAVVTGGTDGPKSFGGSMVVAAQVVAPGGGTPTGTVTFTEDDVVVGSGVIGAYAPGYAGFSTATLTVGTHHLRASYGGDAWFGATQSATFDAVVTRGQVQLTVDPNGSSTNVGTMVTFTVTATPVPLTNPTPTGTVVIRDNGAVLATGLDLTGGVATFQTDGLAPGVHVIDVDYSGDAITLPTTRQVSHRVHGVATSAGLVAGPNPADEGEAVTLSVGLMSGDGAATGVVEFRDGATVLGTAPVQGPSAVLVVTDLAPGPHSITATYLGDALHDPATSAPAAVFVRFPASVDVTSGAATSLTNGTVSFTATVSSSAGVPTGSVSFRADSCTIDGGAALVAGVATVVWNPQSCGGSAAAPGGHTITARYLGDATRAPATGTRAHVLQSVLDGWGRNSSGQVGDGTTTDRVNPARAAIGYGQVSAGVDFSLGIRDDGALFAWGANGDGQLGLGTVDSAAHPSPARVGTAAWRAVSAGRRHVVGIRADGSLWAWGAGSSGQIGDGGFTSRSAPVQIGSATDWQRVAAGSATSFAIKADGSLWAWGQNSFGELGDGTTAARTVPVRVGTGTDWASVAADGTHTYATRTDGSLWVWGRGEPYLGDGSAAGTTYSVPTRIGTRTDWAAVSTSIGNALALRTDGSVWGWGDNDAGALGDGTTTPRAVPVQVLPAAAGVVAISIRGNGGDHALALTGDRRVYAWGNNASTQSGTGTVATPLLTPSLVPGRSYSAISAGADHSLAAG
jgi:alpha-tubulin suppressor-like RCC1 family protein